MIKYEITGMDLLTGDLEIIFDGVGIVISINEVNKMFKYIDKSINSDEIYNDIKIKFMSGGVERVADVIYLVDKFILSFKWDKEFSESKYVIYANRFEILCKDFNDKVNNYISKNTTPVSILIQMKNSGNSFTEFNKALSENNYLVTDIDRNINISFNRNCNITDYSLLYTTDNNEKNIKLLYNTIKSLIGTKFNYAPYSINFYDTKYSCMFETEKLYIQKFGNSFVIVIK